MCFTKSPAIARRIEEGASPDQVLALIVEYLRGLDPNSIAIVYLAGHGVEIAGENLLLLNHVQTGNPPVARYLNCYTL